MKNGFLTSEFWVTTLTTVASLFVLSGYIPSGDSTQLVDLGKQVISGIIALASIISYVQGRVELKKTMLESNREIETKVLG